MGRTRINFGAVLVLSLICLLAYSVPVLRNINSPIVHLLAKNKFAGKTTPVTYVDISEAGKLPPSVAQMQNRVIHFPADNGILANGSFVYLIFSYVSHTERRNLIRETWGSVLKHCEVRVIFVLGVPDVFEGTDGVSAELQASVNNEAMLHRDILQFGNFIDTDRNTTFKTWLAYQWILIHYPHTTYIAKADDDSWINIEKFHAFVLKNFTESKLFGHLLTEGAVVFRDPNSMFYVSRHDYPLDVYPQHLSGILYALPTRTLKRMMETAANVTRIPLENVYWTGIVARTLNLQYQTSTEYEFDYLIDDSRKPSCVKQDLIAVDSVPLDEILRYWIDPCHNFSSEYELCQ